MPDRQYDPAALVRERLKKAKARTSSASDLIKGSSAMAPAPRIESYRNPHMAGWNRKGSWLESGNPRSGSVVSPITGQLPGQVKGAPKRIKPRVIPWTAVRG